MEHHRWVLWRLAGFKKAEKQLKQGVLDPSGRMLNSIIVRTVEFCTRRARAVVIAALALAIAAGVYTARHFAIDTNINNLLSADLPWRQHQLQFQAAFPQTKELLLVVVDASTLKSADAATEKLTPGVAGQDRCPQVRRGNRRRRFL